MTAIFINKRLAAVTAAVLLVLLAAVPHVGKSDSQVSAYGTELPVIMYHSVCDGKMPAEYVVSTDTFRRDMEYLRERGYTAVLVSDLTGYAYEGKSLPEKPVMITLDDGFLNNLTCVLPILEQTDMRAVVSVVGSFTEQAVAEGDRNDSYAYLTWDDIAELAGSGRVDIGNHTYDMHEIGQRKGCTKKSCESSQQYCENLGSDLEKLQKLLKEKSGVTAKVFAYPYGFVCDEAVPVIKELGFSAAFNCGEKMNLLTGDPSQLYALYRFNRPSGISTASYMQKIGIK